MFFFKPKVIHLDCFITRPDVNEFFPVDYANKFFPEWWKKLPKDTGRNQTTMKLCNGFNNLYTRGIIIPLWTSMIIDIKKDLIIFSDMTTKSDTHDYSQMQGYIDPSKYRHFKIVNPWYFKCKEEIYFSFQQPLWSFSDLSDIFVSPGVVDYKYQNGTNINFFMNLENPKIELEAGQPMAHIIPLSERKLKIHRHVVSNHEMDKVVINNTQPFFRNKYAKRKLMIDKKESEKKCPFGF